ncbi:hypothetical protein EDB85DRAFT_2014061 [Lactarius pseudohatsudake]|nr:hypothetical protein EDB85DRAFT_2014061 [Lactarius pseudohatsudake]
MVRLALGLYRPQMASPTVIIWILSVDVRSQTSPYIKYAPNCRRAGARQCTHTAPVHNPRKTQASHDCPTPSSAKK